MRVNLVAAVNPSIPAASGVRTYVFTLGRELASLGVEVCVLGCGPETHDDDGFEFKSVIDQPVTSPKFILALAKFVKRREGLRGLIHGNRPDDLLPFHVGCPELPTVLTLHGAHGLHVRAKRGLLKAKAYELAERRALDRARAILCVSPDTLGHFKVRYPAIATRLRMIPAGVDMAVFRRRSREEARARLRLPQNHKLVAFIGRFEPEKNPVLVAKQFLALSERHDDVRLVMVGSGRLAPEIRWIARSAPERITLMEPMGQESLAWLLNAADVLVVASRHEGLPTIAIEAEASGVPVVATPVGILPDVITAGTNGFLVDGTAQLGPFIERALYEVDWVGDACRASVRMFGWDRIAPAILEVYREIST